MIARLIYRQPEDPMPVELPLSKSIAIRVLSANAVSKWQGRGEADIPKMPDCDDALRFSEALMRVGEGGNTVYIGEGGTPLRFFISLMASMPGRDVSVSCSRGLMRRPLKPLLDALRSAGAELRCLRREDYPPLRILGRQLGTGYVTIDPSVSSQFISALMLAAPLWQQGLRLKYGDGKRVSTPYIEMTAAVMKRFGADVEISSGGVNVASGSLTPPEVFPIETDWSAASYFYELSLLLPGKTIPLLQLSPAEGSLQGDARCEEIFRQLGVETSRHDDGSVRLRSDPDVIESYRNLKDPFLLDLNSTPDLVPAIAVGLCCAGIHYKLTGIGHLRHKESNRLMALANEMEKIGYRVEFDSESLSWTGGITPVGENETIATYSDHRIAMAFAPATVRMPYLYIADPEVVRKSFPGYWKALEGLGFDIIIK